MTAPVGAPTHLSGVAAGGGIGASPLRPDGVLKVRGEFAYASDLWIEGMLWGSTLRSPHPFARIRSIDVREARTVAGVRAVPVLGADHAELWWRKSFRDNDPGSERR